MKETVLVVDDEPRIRRIVEMALGDRGYRVLTAESAERALDVLRQERADAVVTDVQLPGRSGLDLLADIRREWPEVPVVLITAFGTVEAAVEAIKAGAYDYVLKPFGVDELEAVVEGALAEGRGPRDALRGLGSGPEGVVAESPGMKSVMSLVAQVAEAPTTVLITGETGVGKEVVAKAIHRSSARVDHPFVAVNCAAIPGELLEAELFGVARGAYTGAVKDRPGKLEVADGGTLFLDEVGDMPPALQPKLLRVLQDGAIERLGSNVTRSVDVRIVTATHRELATLVDDGRFREDLFYRINVFPIHVPPLRERPEDIEPLARQALRRMSHRLGVSTRLTAPALERLKRHTWPGNVRELLNVLERAVLMSEGGLLEDVRLDGASISSARHSPGAGAAIGASISAPAVEAESINAEVTPLSEAVADAERAAIAAALDRTDGNKAQAARLLGVSVRTLFYKLEKLGLK